MNDPMDELLSAKELASRLKRCESYVDYMKKKGFRMIAGRTTLRAALTWLAKHPKPCTRSK